MPAWKFSFDHAQRRFSRLRIGVAIAGAPLLYDEYSSGVLLEPVTNSVLLKPRCYDASWQTSNSGDYAKLGLTDFGSPAGLTVRDQSGVGARPYLVGAKNIDLLTTTTWGKNQGFVVSYLGYSNGADTVCVLEGGWNSTASSASGTAFRLFASGYIEIWRDGLKVSSGSIAGGYAPNNVQNQTTTLLILPCRHREILFWTTTGAGFRVVLPDVDEDAADPTIVPSSKFWLRQPDISTNIMAAPLKFATSGYAVSELYQLAEAPDTLDVYESYDNASFAGGTSQSYRIYGDESYMTGNSDAASALLVDGDGTTFTQDASNRECRIKVNLSGDGLSTPMVYGAETGFLGVEGYTNDTEEYDATAEVASFSIQVPDAGGVTAHCEIIQSDEILAAVSGLKAQANRPFKVECGTTVVLDGRLSPAHYPLAISDKAAKVYFEIFSTIQALKNYRIRDLKPFDGMLVSHATDECVIRWCLRQVGVDDADMELETSSVRVGDIAPEKCGEFNESASVGASLWEVITRFMEDYFGGWFYDLVPKATGMKFVVCSQATLEAASVGAVLYTSKADAEAALIPSDEIWMHVARKVETQVVAPEANEVVVTGYDPRTKTALAAIKRDSVSQDPVLVPSLRPDNWLGEPAIVGILNSGLTTQQLVEDAALVVFARLSVARKLIDIECEFQFTDEENGIPLWRGDRVTLDGEDYIVQSLSMELVSDADGFKWLPAKYTLSNLIGSTAGMGASQIAAIERRKREEKIIERRESQKLRQLLRGALVVA